MAENALGAALKHYRDRAHKTIPAIADATGIDRVYLYRLEAQETDWLNRPLEGGRPKQPSRDLIIRIAWVLGVTLDECDELLMLAGYAPLYVIRSLDTTTAAGVEFHREGLPPKATRAGNRS
jgi:transcriptional regulator with XRE-family HTH domain